MASISTSRQSEDHTITVPEDKYNAATDDILSKVGEIKALLERSPSDCHAALVDSAVKGITNLIIKQDAQHVQDKLTPAM